MFLHVAPHTFQRSYRDTNMEKQCFPFRWSPENVCDVKHECSANLKLLIMKVVFLFIINVASPNKGRHRSDWLV